MSYAGTLAKEAEDWFKEMGHREKEVGEKTLSIREQMVFHQVPTNCGPLSVVTKEGIPNILTHSENIFLAALAPVRPDMVTRKAMV